MLRRSRDAANEARRLNALLDVLDEGVAVCSGMQAVAVNTSLCRLIGIERDDVGHLMISSFIADADVIDRLLGEGELRLDTEITNRAGATIAVEIAARTIPYGEGAARLLEFRDVGERKHTQARVSFLAHHDPLTALPNRELMRARLKRGGGARRAPAGTSFAVLWIDLDHFKEINDIHGHVVGDQILRIVAEKLKFEMPADTLIARLGGDEFVVLCEESTTRGGAPDRPATAPAAQSSDRARREIARRRRLDRRRGLSRTMRPTSKTCSRTPTSRSITPRPKGAAAAATSPRNSATSASAAWC